MTDTGVVDPIRIPDWVRDDARRAWRATPMAARLFAGVALLDVLSRGMGILQPRFDVGFDLFTVYSMLIPHDLWILLPAVLVLRNPDARRVTPRLFVGAVIVALATALGRPIANLAYNGNGTLAGLFEVSILENVALGLGWLLIARGLAALDVREAPSPGVAGLSNLVVILGGIGLAAQLGRSLSSGSDFGYAGIGGLVVLSDLGAAGSGAIWLYLLWTAIRSFGDSRRPAIATAVAAVGASITGILAPVVVMLDVVIQVAGSPIPLGGGALRVEDVASALTLSAVGIGEGLLVVAFALGLGDPAVPYLAPAAEAATATEPDAPLA